jgi:uncharacterized protein YgbK (DUF1537 family)
VEFSTASDAPVLVIDTETRHVAAGDAAGRIVRLAREARARGVPFIYKKTDSTLRGNIGAELAALREADPESALIYAPAYPAVGRTVRGGRLYVYGVPVDQTAFALDPLNPIRESEVAHVLANADEGIRILDGETEADVRAAARAAAAGRLAAGPAGFAEALAEVLDLPRGATENWPPLCNAMLVNGSLHPVALAQEQYAAAHGWLVLRVPEEADELPLAHAQRVAETVRGALDEFGFDALVIFGGDTAFAILDALGRPPVYPVRELVTGAPISRTAVNGRPLWLVTKAGGFGPPDETDAIRAMMESGS